MKESQLLRACLDLLQAKGIFAIRQNTGAVRTEGGGFMRFGVPGQGDILAFPHKEYAGPLKPYCIPVPMWIECKTEKGKQSELQKSFEDKVMEQRHRYFVVRSIEDLILALESI